MSLTVSGELAWNKLDGRQPSKTNPTRVLYQVTATAAGAAPTKAATRRYYMFVTMATLDCILFYGRCNGNSSLIRLRQHHSRILFKLAGPRAS